MMNELSNLLAQATNGTEEWLSFLGDYTRYFNPQTLGAGGVAAVLVALWFLARVLRTIVTVGFVLCVLFLVLHIAGYADISVIWETVSGWMGK